MITDSELMYPCCVLLCPQCERQMTQSLLDTKANTFVTLPPGEIRPPSKLIDRTHHVTEKVTQVSGPRVLFQARGNKKTRPGVQTKQEVDFQCPCEKPSGYRLNVQTLKENAGGTGTK